MNRTMLAPYLAVALLLPAHPADADRGDYQPPEVLSGRPELQSRPARNLEERIAVSIYEFRSGVTEIPARASTDMFKTALVRSGQFRVVERSRLAEGVAVERKLSAEGATDTSIDRPLRAVKYLFEGTISEAAPSEKQRSQTVSLAGLEVGGGSNRDYISIDVRVVEVATGDIVDVVTVRKTVAGRTSSIGGVGNAIGAVLAQRGKATPFVPDLRIQEQQKESLDAALREAIDVAVAELAARLVR